MTHTERHTCAVAPIPVTAVDRIELFPIGSFKTDDSRAPMSLDDAAGVIARSMARAPGGVLPIDFDHRSFNKPSDTRAAGWITGLEVEGDRIMASVEWTQAGRDALDSRSYRFVSPVFKTERASRRVTLIEGGGLVNFPALPELRQLASKEDAMNPIDKIAGLLGLSADATDKIEGRVTALLATESHLASIATAAGVEGDDVVTQICSRLDETRETGVDPAKYAPMSVVNDLQRQLASVQTQLDGGKVDDAIEAARQAGKLIPSQEPWAREYASKDLDGFNAWAGGAPQILSASRVILGDPPPSDAKALSPEERQICSQMGLSEDEFLTSRNTAKKEV
jgi:phage I-like protein